MPDFAVDWVEKLQLTGAWVQRDGGVELVVSCGDLQVFENIGYWSATMADAVSGEIAS